MKGVKRKENNITKSVLFQVVLSFLFGIMFFPNDYQKIYTFNY